MTDPLGYFGFYEPVSSLTHLIGAVACAAMTWPFIKKAQRTPGGAGRWRIASLILLALCTFLLLISSGFFHKGEPGGLTRRVFQRLDRDAIFLVIAGTFTPVHVIMFRDIWRWGVLAFIWVVAITGVTLTSVFMGDMPHWLGMSLYLGMGWFGASSIVSLGRRRGWRSVLPLILGAVAYTAGAMADFALPSDVVRGWIGSHELFHLFVLLGLALHWRYIWSIADAAPTKRPSWTADLTGK